MNANTRKTKPASGRVSVQHTRKEAQRSNDANNVPANQAPEELIRVLPDPQSWRGFLRSDHRALAGHGARAFRRALERQRRRGRS